MHHINLKTAPCDIVLLPALTARGAELPPLITTPGETLLAEDFTGAEIPKSFRTLESAASSSIVDGALQAVSRAGQARSTHGVVWGQPRGPNLI